jgi:GNAT superfamily N-acetyltransferase
MPELHHPFHPNVLRLFDPSMVNAPVAWGVLEGTLPGVVAVDDEVNPRWAVGRMHWNLGFAAGKVDCSEAAIATAQLARWGAFGVFRADDDLDIPGSLRQVERLEFTGPRRAVPEIPLPADCQIVPLTVPLLKRCQWGEGTGNIWGGPEHFIKRGIGFCLIRGSEILCEVPAFSIGAGKVELSVITHPDHRGRGYAKITCRHMATACEGRGLIPTYSCDLDNHSSVAVARSLGFTLERRCRAVTYAKPI